MSEGGEEEKGEKGEMSKKGDTIIKVRRKKREKKIERREAET